MSAHMRVMDTANSLKMMNYTLFGLTSKEFMVPQKLGGKSH